MASQSVLSHPLPPYVGVFNPMVAWLLKIGAPLGPNALLTVRGRKSGEPRTTPVAVIEIGGRRWLSSPYGDVQWVRNLRSAGEGRVRHGRRSDDYRAVELDEAEKSDFFANTMGPYVRRLPIGRWMVASLLGAPEMLDDPKLAARLHPVFELLPKS